MMHLLLLLLRKVLFAAQGAATPAAEEKTEFDVVLKVVGDQKINVIKVVKAATGLGLKEAKELVESAPKLVKREKLSKDEAEKLKKDLESCWSSSRIKINCLLMLYYNFIKI